VSYKSDHSVLLEDGWITKATKTTRKAVLVSFLVVAIFVAVLLLERFAFNRANEQAATNVQLALQISADILLEDERLTMSANLAAATGQKQWVDRYEASIPVMDAAIAQAMALAPSGAAERFNLATKDANDQLVLLERIALTKVVANDLAGAHTILNSPNYLRNKQILLLGTQAFTRELREAVETQLAATASRSWQIAGSLGVAGVTGFLFLWHLLNKKLKDAQIVFSEKQREIATLAMHDTLTGLPNRRYLTMRLQEDIARCHRTGGGFALMALDLNQFKPINDRYGHAVGDRVLGEIAQRLLNASRKTDLVSRVGGDEFIIVLSFEGYENESKDSATAIGDSDTLIAAKRMLDALTKKLVIAQVEMTVGVSAGLALFPEHARDAEELIRNADLALYSAKAVGSKEPVLFNRRAQDFPI
jgi:diguanylate cyclase (GGDEF)-like protein